MPLDLEPYRTQTIDYLFYFPQPGQFAHFPAHVAKNEKVVAAAKPATFDVVEKPTKPDTESWDYVSQNGTDDEVLGVPEPGERPRPEPGEDRLPDAGPGVLRAGRSRSCKDRHAYHPTLWSYAPASTTPRRRRRSSCTHADQLVAEGGGPIDTPLLTIDPVARHQYEHLEYKPLVNARAHALGNRRQIVNAGSTSSTTGS